MSKQAESPPPPQVIAAPTAPAPVKPNAPRRPLPCLLHWRYRDVGAAAMLAAVFLFVDSVPLWHTDVWAHAKFGEWIVREGHLPEHEPFTPWSDPAAPYVSSAWLSQVVFYLT